MSDNREGHVLVWDCKVTDWKSYALDERVQVPPDDHTLLMRVPILLGLPAHLRVEMQVQAMRPDTITFDDPRHPSKAKGKERAQPFGNRNAVKREADIDLVAEEEHEIQARLAAATEDGCIDVEKFFSM